MKRKNFRLTLLLLGIISLMILNSCTGPKAKVDSFGQADIPENERYSEPGHFPFVRKDANVTLKIAVDHPALVKDFINNEFTKYIEDKSNIKIEWIIWDSSESRKKFLNSMETGSYPDIFLGMAILNSDIEKYGVQGKKFISISDLIDKQTVKLKKILKDRPEFIKYITASDGQVYSVPSLEEYYPGVYGSKVWINNKWLKNLNLKMPETTVDFYNTLVAFRDKDPNGNKENDEIPFVFGNVQHSSLNFLLNSFLFTNYEFTNYSMLNLDNNKKVVADIEQPQFKEALKYLNKLYNEKLIYNDSFNKSATEIKYLFSVSPGEIGAFAAENPMTFLNKYEDLEDYVVLSPLEGPESHVSAAVYPDYPGIGSFVITDKCKEPIVAMKLADYLLTHEGSLNSQYGIKGKGWYDANEWSEGIFGDEATWVLNEGVQAQENNYKWLRGPYWLDTSLMVRQTYPSENNSVKNKNDLTRFLYKQTKSFYEPFGQDYKKNVLPPVRFNNDEKYKVQQIWGPLTQYIKDESIRLITQNASIDTEWTKYVSRLNELKLKEYINIYQQAYDRQFK